MRQEYACDEAGLTEEGFVSKLEHLGARRGLFRLDLLNRIGRICHEAATKVRTTSRRQRGYTHAAAHGVDTGFVDAVDEEKESRPSYCIW